MTETAVHLDLTRMLGRAGRAAPTGIDRWDRAVAIRLLDGVPELRLVPVVQVGGRLRHLPRAAGLIAAAAEGRETAWGGMRQALARATRPVQGPGIWLTLSHHGLEDPQVWAQAGRLGLRPVVYLHDLIPIRHPSTTRPEQPARHALRLRHAVDGAAHLLCPSRAVATELAAWIGTRHPSPPPVTVLPPGLEPWAMQTAQADRRDGPLVMLGTLEPRKGHDLLPGLWRDWTDAPRLTLIGARGWRGTEIADRLSRTPELAGRLRMIGPAPDTVLAREITQARSLILPSRAEGWGMPVAEALSLGTPVICTDLPALREASQGRATLLPLPDRPETVSLWRRAVSDIPPAAPPVTRQGWDARLMPLWDLLRTAQASHTDAAAALAGPDDPADSLARRSRRWL